jgi:hypothetical protein
LHRGGVKKWAAFPNYCGGLPSSLVRLFLKSESGEGLFPPGSSPLSDLQSQNEERRGTERKYPMNRLIQFRMTISISFALAISPMAQAVVPAPDGGYPGGNTAEGQDALFSLANGTYNTAVGFFALKTNIAGFYNTAIGAGTLFANTADENTATGAGALLSNTTGFENTAHGAFALISNTEGMANTAVGDSALFSNTTGFGNTATGFWALKSNPTGSQNTGTGYRALTHNTDGTKNTATGFETLFSSTTGSSNTALGYHAGNNVTTASNVTCIGANVAGADVSNTTWIGNVYGVTTQSGTTAPVIVSDTGQLGTVTSSERFKKDITTMEKASEAILSLRPVSFHYKRDAKRTPQFGLIAEEVAKVNPALVLPDKDGKPYSVRYDAVNAMLLNEFLKAHHKIGEQNATIAQLKQDLIEQRKQIEALTAGLQKVSVQLEVSKSAAQTVVNNQ